MDLTELYHSRSEIAALFGLILHKKNEIFINVSQKTLCTSFTFFSIFRTSHMIPVDLNCFLEKNSRILSEFYSEFDEEKRSKFRTIADDLRRGIEKVFSWIWISYNLFLFFLDLGSWNLWIISEMKKERKLGEWITFTER